MGKVLKTRKGSLLRGLWEIKRNSAWLQFPEKWWKSYQMAVKVEKKKEMSMNQHCFEISAWQIHPVYFFDRENTCGYRKTSRFPVWTSARVLKLSRLTFSNRKCKKCYLLIQEFWSSLSAFFLSPLVLQVGISVLMHISAETFFSWWCIRFTIFSQVPHVLCHHCSRIMWIFWQKSGHNRDIHLGKIQTWSIKQLVEEVETCLTGCDWAENPRTQSRLLLQEHFKGTFHCSASFKRVWVVL